MSPTLAVIKAVLDTKSEELGMQQYRFKAEIAFRGDEIGRRVMQRCGANKLHEKLRAALAVRHHPTASGPWQPAGSFQQLVLAVSAKWLSGAVARDLP